MTLAGEPTALARPLRQPARLGPGSRVTVLSPSGPADAALVAEGCAILASWDLAVEVAPHALDRHPGLRYLAGQDAARADDLEQAWLDPGVGAILCARGGYGAQCMVDLPDWAAMSAVPPPVLAGFSDITALHEAVARRLGVATLHAPNVGSASFTAQPSAQRSLRAALFGTERPAALVAPAEEEACLVPGAAAGVTAGGNLALLAAGLGTQDGRQSGGFAGCILLLEDVTEEPYRLDRMLTQLLRSGALDAVAGVALGSWTDCGPPDAVRQVMRHRLGGLGVPVAWGLGFGHTSPQPTVPLGARAELDATVGTLTFLDPALA